MDYESGLTPEEMIKNFIDLDNKPVEVDKLPENSLEKDLHLSPKIKEKMKSYDYAVQLYNSLCNNSWTKNGEEWSCSWRYAGGIASELHGDGKSKDYMDFYVTEGTCPGLLSEEVEEDLNELGWEHVPDEDNYI